MTNGDKYKTARERAEAFRQFCDEGYMKQDCINCPLVKGSSCDYSCTFAWLYLEAEEEKPLPCPFCGNDKLTIEKDDFGSQVHCFYCGYRSIKCGVKSDPISAHNLVAKKCMEVKE